MSEKRVVGVRFRRAGKVYYFDPGDTEPAVGDTVIVETVRGTEAGEVVVPARVMPEASLSQPLRSVVRKATPDDQARIEENRRKEKEAIETCAAKIKEHGLDMHLVGAEYTFDRGKLIFYFTADGRVDFRQLVRDLSSTFKTRIELRQIGVRDEAKMIGGLGSCGRQLCCATFLSEFQPVSIRMAKRQDLSLNPTKISGLCGRLMCCLRYECDFYPETRKAAGAGESPRPDGEGPPDGQVPAENGEGARVEGEGPADGRDGDPDREPPPGGRPRPDEEGRSRGRG
ncbi:MAG: stage 0 sporulation family protein [Bacillota bacterium]